jgi:hypothetical protein
METARLFNSALATAALSSAFELGLLEVLEHNETVQVSSLCNEREFHRPSIVALLRALACFNIVDLSADSGVARRGQLFADAYREKGYFLWLMKGYGHLLQNLADLVKRANRPSDGDDLSFVRRDLRHIAIAGSDYGAQFVDRYLDEMVNQRSFSVACDLGCGSAERLLDLAQKHPEIRGVGIDISGEAITIAEHKIKEAALGARITVLMKDVKDLARSAAFTDVDLLLCFFMGHDLWPRKRCAAVLRELLSVFPRVQRFLFCDTYRSEAPLTPDLPTFTLGFELTHAVMGRYIPSEAEWLALFEETGWQCVGKMEVELPFSAIFDLRPARHSRRKTKPRRVRTR